MRTNRTLAALLLAFVALGCDYHYRFETPTAPTALATAPISSDTVEFRVSGDLPFVQVRVNNSLDGLSQFSTVLPYTSQLPLGSRDSAFLSIDARGSGFGFLHAAIFVNGVIFREGSSSQWNPVVIVEGTYRRTR